MNKILYYPYINVPRTDWALRALLYYENMGSIVPQEYFYNPERTYEPFMLELVKNELVIPIDPIKVLDNPWVISEPFLKYVEQNRVKLEEARQNSSFSNGSLIHSDKFYGARIHADKFDESIFYSLEQLGLARRNGRWYFVETQIADQLMKFLATVISAKLNMLPTTDFLQPTTNKNTRRDQQRKRETILNNLIPFPKDIDLKSMKKFKERNNELLIAFKNRVEQIVLDPNLMEGTEQFDEIVKELQIRKKELSIKMKESKFRDILLGTVCGIIGAVQGLTAAETTGALIGAFPGFASAIHSALKIEKAECIFDQSGLKYLALVDKRLRK